VFPEIGQFPGQKTGSEEEKHEDLQGKDADSFVVMSCPECGAVTDIDYGTVKDKPPNCQAYGEREADKVPFSAQEWMFESLCEVEIENLHDLIDDHHDLIIEMARDRFRKGFCKYGSTMYSWSPERRLDETLQELADATVYHTSGPLE